MLGCTIAVPFPLKLLQANAQKLRKGFQILRMRCLATIATNIEAVPSFQWEKYHRFTVAIIHVQPHGADKESSSISILKLSSAMVSPPLERSIQGDSSEFVSGGSYLVSELDLLQIRTRYEPKSTLGN